MKDIVWPPENRTAAWGESPTAPPGGGTDGSTGGNGSNGRDGGSVAPAEAFRKTTGAKVWTVVFGIILALMAYGSMMELVAGVQVVFDPDGEEAQDLENFAKQITGGLLWLNSILLLVLFGLIPLAWVALTRVQPNPGTWIYLHLVWQPDTWRRLAQGLGLGILLWLGVVVLSTIQLAIEGELSSIFDENATADSPIVEAFLREITWPLAIFMALVAGFAEEVFFRGVLQRWIGWWGQAIAFGLTHASYGTWEQIVFPFGLGLLFGWLVKRGYGLWLVIAAHFMFDFVQFALALALA